MTGIGILHPGEMGSAVGAALVDHGCEVLWVATGRSAATRRRAQVSGLTAVDSLGELTERCETILSICPPDAALDVAREVAGYAGLYIDANATSPETARLVQATLGGRCVDGSIIGPPPEQASRTRLYLSGPLAAEAAGRFDGTRVEAVVLRSADPFAASALKMTYAGWTKGSAALLLAVAEAAQRLGVLDSLQAEWALSQPQLVDRLVSATRARTANGWRWEGEMREIAATLRGVDLPGGFHDAAAEIFGAAPRPDTD